MQTAQAMPRIAALASAIEAAGDGLAEIITQHPQTNVSNASLVTLRQSLETALDVVNDLRRAQLN